MPLTISIITTIPFSEPVIRNRLFPIFEELEKKGFQVRCVCLKSELNNSLPKNVLVEEIEIQWKKSKNFISRFFKETIIAAKLLKKAKKTNDHVVMVTIPSMFLSFLTPIYFRGKPLLLDIRDLTWEYLSEATFLNKCAKLFFRFLFKRSLPHYRLTTVTNESEFRFVRSLSLSGKVLLISNGVRRKEFDKLSQIQPSCEDVLTVSYVGNVGLAQRLDTLIEAAKLLPKVRFIIAGDGVELNRLKALVSQYSLENVELLGHVSWERVFSIYNASHILYAQLTPDFQKAMPSKLYEYLATGKHIVYGGTGQAAETLKKFEANDIVDPCNTKALVEKLSELERCLDRGYLSEKNKEKIKENFIREKNTTRLVQEIEQASK